MSKTTVTEKRQCAQGVMRGFYRHLCQKNATVERNGHWWCSQHDPDKVKARAEASHNKWKRDFRIKMIPQTFHARLVDALTETLNERRLFLQAIKNRGNSEVIEQAIGLPAYFAAMENDARLLAEIEEARK